MPAQLTDIVAVLRNTPATLSALLHDLSPAWTHANYGPDTFSPFDVVGHLIHGEMTDWIPRLTIILEHGVARPFEPFDRYAMYQLSEGRTMAELLDEFARRRTESLNALEGFDLGEADLAKTGMHPALGVVTARQLLSAWVAHDLNHIHQVAKAMAYQYREAAQPIAAYLGVLKDFRS